MQQLSIWERFLADTPPFFKKTRALGLFILATAFMIMQTAPAIVPAKWILAIGLLGLAIAVLSSFAVKDIAAIQSGTPLTIESLMGIVGDVTSQIAEVKSLIASPPTTLAQAKAIADALPADPPAPQVVVVNNAAPASTAPAATEIAPGQNG